MMLCFQVQVDDEPPITAGEPSINVLSAIATYVAQRGELELTVGGLISRSPTDNERLSWLRRPLRPGDTVALRVIETDRPDAPERRDRDDPELVERERRRYYERLKQTYEGTDVPPR